ncbi:MAG: kelch repeat-containing protein, partial [Planctomycetota bacterium]
MLYNIQNISNGSSKRKLAIIISGVLLIALIAIFNHVSCGGGGSSGGSSNPPPPPPPQNPSLTTNPATNITKNSAILNGTVNPDGVNTSVYFEYGKTITYGSITPYQNIGSGTSNINVYANLTSLSTNTTYNFRLVVNQGGLTFNGANQAFTTVGLPTCTTNPANNITLDSATLNGQVNPNGFITDLYFNYGLTTSYTITTTLQSIGFGTSNVTVTAALSGLSASTSYNFRVVGSNSNGTTYGDNLIFITGSPSGSSPTCTTDPATTILCNSAKLKGTVNPNGTSTTGYFDYGLTTSYTVTTTVQTIGNGITSVAVTANISGLSSTTVYNFRVVGINGTGTTYGNNMTFTTAPPPPSSTTNDADNITYNSARLNGTVNPNGLPTIAYFEYGLTTTPYTSTTTPRTSGNGTSDVAVSAALSSLNAQTLYNFRCVADNSSGTTYGNNITFTTAPPLPTCTTNPATNITQVSATLNGTVNPNGITTTAYFNYGLTTSYTVTTTEQTIISGTGNVAVTADISGLSPNTVYNFRCVATNSRGTTYGTNRTFGHWSTTTFTPPGRGVFNDTTTANSDNDDVVLALNWLQRYSTTVTPTERYSHSMAYDSVRRKTVLFGGGWTTTYNNETWEWDGANWLQRYSTTVTPTERRYTAMAYDSLRQKTVLFGGNTGAANNETWEWDGTNWTQRNPATSPSARYGHAMAYDSVRQKIVLFGGTSGGNETW